ncbi:hypothetical protein HanHA300_Chr12g0449251 [Helianthus annuus]|nr:hypothetical protein HanHA300_Chr12g0449251 [Helianthus annuus]KAJ0675484.1 hypothetical protein HanLR1_Chr12g0451691 [Helianthus annuus]KAJ0678775.1 hypothetical protein HanOQP8_Chr12g0451711 [Helianthus annuus]
MKMEVMTKLSGSLEKKHAQMGSRAIIILMAINIVVKGVEMKAEVEVGVLTTQINTFLKELVMITNIKYKPKYH